MLPGSGRRLPHLVFILLAALATYGTIGAVALIRDRGDDFQRLYISASSWTHGGNPYAVVVADTPNLNHPLLLPLLWLFTLGSEHAGFVAWSVLSLLVLAALTPAISRRASIAPLDLFALVLSSTGTFLVLVFGQVSFLLMILFTIAWIRHRDGDSVTAGALLGLLSVLKPFFGLFGLFLLARREWRAFAVYVVTFLAGNAVGVALVGVSGFREWTARLQEVQWRWHIYNASAWGVGDRLFSIQPFFRATQWTPIAQSVTLDRLLTIVLLLVVFLVLWRCLRIADVDQSYALLGLGSLLISPLGWLYYLPTFAGPVTTVLGRRPSIWLWPILTIGACPIALLVSRSYGVVGTIIVGQWAFAVVGGLLLLAAAAPSPEWSR